MASCMPKAWVAPLYNIIIIETGKLASRTYQKMTQQLENPYTNILMANTYRAGNSYTQINYRKRSTPVGDKDFHKMPMRPPQE